jgi:hypothetical protein
MRGPTPTVLCDAEDSLCGNWDVDYYEATASTVNGVRITQEARAPGWVNGPDFDYCPDHATTKDQS